jgi:ATP-dependent helicase/nuclease subunit B
VIAGKYKPIVVELENGKKVEIVGKIDRLDIGKLDDKTYVRIIDYKSSIKNIDMNQVEAGLQIQLITYLDAVSKQEDFLPSGILYLGLTDNKVTNKRNLSEEEIKQEIRKKFRMNGIVLADINVIKMMDTNISGASTIIPVTLKQDGSISESKSSAINEQEFEELQKSVTNTIKQISTEILSGNIDIKPYNYKMQTGCDYCEYKSICMFNPNLKENTYNYIKKSY